MDIEAATAALRAEFSPAGRASWHLFTEEVMKLQRSRGEQPHLPEDPDTITSVCDALRKRWRPDGRPCYSEATIQWHLSTWQFGYRILRQAGLTEADPFPPLPRPTRRARPALSQEEVAKLLA